MPEYDLDTAEPITAVDLSIEATSLCFQVKKKQSTDRKSFTGGSHQKRRERPAAIHFQCKLASMSGRRR